MHVQEAWLDSNPPVCEAAVVMRKDAIHTARMSYADAEFWVEVVHSMGNADPRFLFGASIFRLKSSYQLMLS